MKPRPLVIGAAAVVILIAAILVWQPWSTPPTIESQVRDLGFTPVLPPSKLPAPGSVVVVEARDPLRLGVVCPDVGSLGDAVQEALIESETVSVMASHGLHATSSFTLDDVRHSSSASGELSASVEVTLNNVQVLEIPDQAVFELVDQRTSWCDAALEFRQRQGLDVTMVKSVLLADASFTTSFGRSVSAKARAEFLDDLRARVGGTISRDDANTVQGSGLIWGVKDDPGLLLIDRGKAPPTGQARPAPVLRPDETATISPARIVSYSVPIVVQPSSMSCWAAAGAMLRSWQRDDMMTAESFARSLGDPWQAYFERDTGIAAVDHAPFADAAGFIAHAPQNFTIEAYFDMLREFGPLWIASSDNFLGVHARVLVGMYGDLTPEFTVMEFIDPVSGDHTRESFVTFLRYFEQEASTLPADTELRWQLFHLPP